MWNMRYRYLSFIEDEIEPEFEYFNDGSIEIQERMVKPYRLARPLMAEISNQPVLL